jgi:arabinofuranosyltransferase
MAPARPVTLRALGPAVFGVALAVRLAILWYADFAYDDAYIIARVARNAAAGDGFVYNVGDRIQAVTSLLYTSLVAAIWTIAGESTLGIVRVLATLADALAAACLALLIADPLRRSDPAPAGGFPRKARPDVMLAAVSGGLFFACLSTSSIVAPGGLETAFYNLAIILTFRFVQLERFTAAGSLSAVSSVLRPDGLLVAASAFVAMLAIRRRVPWKAAGLFVGLFLAYVVFVFAYFGTIVPQSVAAKTLILRDPVEEWGRFMDKFFLGSIKAMIPGLTWVVGAVVAVLYRRDMLPLLFWGVAYAAVFSTFGEWWPWYYPPVTLAYAAGIGLGFGFVVTRIATFLMPRGWVPRAGLVAVGGMCAVLLLQTAQTASRLHSVAPLYLAQRKELAAWLNANVPPQGTILIEPMGMVGYFTHRRIDDYPGLASPRVTAALKSLGREVPGNLYDSEALATAVAAIEPDVVILRQEEYDAATASGSLPGYDVAFVSDTEVRFPEHFPDFQDMIILARRNGRR